MQEEQPIFIIGSVRSGTSIVKQGLTKGAGIPGFIEGCFIDFLGSFLRIVAFNYNRRPYQSKDPRVMLGNIPEATFRRELLQWFKEQYEAHNPFKGQWVDKTADREVLHAVPFLHHLWPQAKCIFMQRRAIENVSSRARKFPHVSLTEHMRLWTELLTLQEEARKRLAPETYMVIDQYDVATSPQATAERIGIFLNLTHAQIEAIAQIFEHDRPEHTGGDERYVCSLADMPWSAAEKEVFMETCAPLLTEMGWSLEKTYYR